MLHVIPFRTLPTSRGRLYALLTLGTAPLLARFPCPARTFTALLRDVSWEAYTPESSGYGMLQIGSCSGAGLALRRLFYAEPVQQVEFELVRDDGLVTHFAGDPVRVVTVGPDDVATFAGDTVQVATVLPGPDGCWVLRGIMLRGWLAGWRTPRAVERRGRWEVC